MSRLFNFAAQLKSLIRSDGQSAFDAEARRFIAADDENDDAFDRVTRGIQRAIGQRGYGRHYNPEDWQYIKNGMRLVNSSNVYGYTFDPVTSRQGILYVQFLNWLPKQFGGTGHKSGPGPTYAYYNVPYQKFQQFEEMARTSAGSAVWDYLRVRHSHHAHQHTYQLVQVSGEYIPRKATAWGLRGQEDSRSGRVPAAIGMGMRNIKGQTARQQLPSRQMMQPRTTMAPRRGTPNRGTPNRGEPDRGQ